MNHLARNLALGDAVDYVYRDVGAGGSTGVAPSTAEAMAQNAIDFLDAMDFERIGLLGFSLGSSVTQDVALIRPSLLRRVVLSSSGHSLSSGSPPFGYRSSSRTATATR